MIDREAPSDREAERAVLGAVLLDGKLFYQARAALAADDFYLERHRRIFRAYEEIADGQGGDAIDMVTLRAALGRGLQDVGGAAYLSGLIDGLPRYSNIEHYARIVKDKALLRRMIDAGTRMINECYYGTDGGQEVYGRAIDSLIGLGEHQAGVRLIALEDTAGELSELLTADAVGDEDFIDTGWEGLDKYGLFRRGKQTIIAALTSMGKTMFLCNVSIRAAERGYHTLYFTREDGGPELRKRMLAADAEVPFGELMRRRGTLSAEVWHRAQAQLELFKKLPIQITDDIGFDIDAVVSLAWQAHAERAVDLIVVDHLQLFGQTENRNVELGAYLLKLRELGAKLNAAVAVASQFSRLAGKGDKETHRPKRPELWHLRDSGEIEQHADKVVFLHRWNYFDSKERGDMGITEVIVAKNRQGPLGSVEMDFDGVTQRVSEVR